MALLMEFPIKMEDKRLKVFLAEYDFNGSEIVNLKNLFFSSHKLKIANICLLMFLKFISLNQFYRFSIYMRRWSLKKPKEYHCLVKGSYIGILNKKRDKFFRFCLHNGRDPMIYFSKSALEETKKEVSLILIKALLENQKDGDFSDIYSSLWDVINILDSPNDEGLYFSGYYENIRERILSFLGKK
jgi:hypothetical protein